MIILLLFKTPSQTLPSLTDHTHFLWWTSQLVSSLTGPGSTVLARCVTSRNGLKFNQRIRECGICLGSQDPRYKGGTLADKEANWIKLTCGICYHLALICWSKTVYSWVYPEKSWCWIMLVIGIPNMLEKLNMICIDLSYNQART